MVQNGPYHRIRHPIYTAFLLILGSTLFISASWLVGGLWIVAVSLDIVPRMRYEEAAMLQAIWRGIPAIPAAHRAHITVFIGEFPKWGFGKLDLPVSPFFIESFAELRKS